MFIKSRKNHRNFYRNIINWKTENCHIGVNVQPSGQHTPQCPIGGDVNDVVLVRWLAVGHVHELWLNGAS